jgi:hypothetical protein
MVRNLQALIRLPEANKQEAGDTMDINVGLRRAVLVGLLGVAAYGSAANAAYLHECRVGGQAGGLFVASAYSSS